MAAITDFTDVEIFQWKSKASKYHDAGTTTLTHDTALPAGITGNFFISVVNPDGTVCRAYVPTGAASDTVLGTGGAPLQWLPQTGGDYTGASGNGIAIKEGALVRANVDNVIIWEISQALLGAVGSGLKLNARPTFSGSGVMAVPVFADATARDAAIASPANGDHCYNTAEGVVQKYEGGTWVNSGTATVANASEAVAGKVELATSAEGLAGTDTGGTGAYLMLRPSYVAANIQNSSYIFAADAEESDTYAITLTPAISAYATGQVFVFSANTANTGAATLNVNAKGEKTIKKHNDQDLEDGDIESGSIVIVCYDGTNFQMLNPPATQISTADVATLTGGSSSDADALHTHDSLTSDNLVGVGSAASTTKKSNFVLPFSAADADGPSAIWLADDFYDAGGGINVYRGSYFQGRTGVADAYLITNNPIYFVGGYSTLSISDSLCTKIIAEFDLSYDATAVSNGNFSFGFVSNVAALIDYDDADYYDCNFSIDTSGNLYAHTANAGGGANHTEEAITGITLTDVNKYRIEITSGTDAKFYVNGVLKATITTNLPNHANAKAYFGAGLREGASNYSGMSMSAPQFSIEF